MAEWLAHYKSIGVDQFIVFDNESSDGTSDFLISLEREGCLHRIPWSSREGVSPQLTAYNEAIKSFRKRFSFMAFFDVDEFLVPRKDLDINLWLSGLPDDVGAVAVNQKIFGSSGRVYKDLSRNVTDRFTRCASDDCDEHLWVKSIYRSNAVRLIYDSHRGALIDGSRYVLPNLREAFAVGVTNGQAQEVDYSLLQLNHYILKSREEFEQKILRGGVIESNIEARLARYNSFFFDHRDTYANNCVDTEVLGYRSQYDIERAKIDSVVVK